MIRLLSILVFFAFCFTNCEKIKIPVDNDPEYPVDPDYPTIIYKVDSITLSQMRIEYHHKYKYLTTSLDQFGFCGSSDEDISYIYPPSLEPLSETEAIQKVKNFIIENPGYTGIKNPDEVSFPYTYSSPRLNGRTWSIRTSYQIYDSLEVRDTRIVFTLKNGEFIICGGNWYPDIYIPSKFNISQEKAKSLLINKVVSDISYSGEKYDKVISAAHMKGSTAKLIVFPITTDYKIELRIAWEVIVENPINCRFFIDVMTGVIITQQRTLYSLN